MVELETLIVLKTMPIRRDKDAVDLISLLRDKRKELNLKAVAERSKSAGLTDHMLDRIRDYARRLRENDLDRVWFHMTATRLPFTEKREIGRVFSNLANLLRETGNP